MYLVITSELTPAQRTTLNSMVSLTPTTNPQRWATRGITNTLHAFLASRNISWKLSKKL
jgi:hypothetical protein